MQGAVRCQLRITARAETNTEKKRNPIPYHPLPDRSMKTSHLTILPLIWTSGDTPLPGTNPAKPHHGSWGQEGSSSSLVLSQGNPWTTGWSKSLGGNSQWTLSQPHLHLLPAPPSPAANLIPHSYHLSLGQEWDGISDGLRANFIFCVYF